jgi:hypothetical protein
MNLVEQSKKYCCLQYALIQANNLIRSKFYLKWKETQRNDWKDIPSNGQLLLRILDSKSNSNFRSTRIFEQKIETGDSKKWDLSIFSTIFRCQPFNSKNLSKNVQIIIEERNKLSHCTTLEVTFEQFEKSWSNISTAMLNLGYDLISLSNIRNQFLKNDSTTLNSNNVNRLIPNQSKILVETNSTPKPVSNIQNNQALNSNDNQISENPYSYNHSEPKINMHPSIIKYKPF